MTSKEVRRRERPTLADVALSAGVSAAAASRAINSRPGVRSDIRERVIEAARTLGYEPNTAAQSLAGRRTGLIGLVVFDSNRILDTRVFSSFIGGVAGALQSRGLHAVLILPEDDSDRRAVGHSIMTDNLDGAIVIGHRADDPLLTELTRDGIPVVCFGQPIGHRRLWWVDQDNALGAHFAVEHLIESGRRRIAILAGPQDRSWGRERLAGAQAALAEAGIPNDDVLVRMCDFTPQSGRVAVHDILRRVHDVDAIFSCSEAIGRGALSALTEAGVRIPAEMSFISYDDASDFEFGTPSVSVIRMPLTDLGVEAARLLVDRIDSGDTAPRHTVLSPSLIPRASTATGG